MAERIEDIITPKVRQALRFAEKWHEGQYRKDGKTPYIMHPRAVLKLALESPWHFTEDELCVMVLHDCIEDTDCTFEDIYKEFGEDVAGMVWLVSKPNEKHFRSKIYEASLKWTSPVVIAIKLLDNLHNVSDLDGVTDDFRRKLIVRVERFAGQLLDILRMHGDVWHNYSNWVYSKLQEALRKARS